MKTVNLREGQTLQVCTPLGIVIVTTGLSDRHGRAVDSIQVKPDAYAGEPRVHLAGLSNSRLIRMRTLRS